jgi:hypothetical protein
MREPSRPHGPAEEALRRLEQRLDQASEAAERLIAEAAHAAAQSAGARGATPPPAGWQVPGSDGPPAHGRPDPELLVRAVQSLRDLIPPELQRRLAEALREVLLAIRALIDWHLERLEQRRSEPPKVQDIPIL